MNYATKVEFELGAVIGFAVLWLVIIIFTLGLGAFVLGYYLPKTVINATCLVDETGRKTGQMVCRLSIGEMIGHALIWIIISILTLGIGFLFYGWSAMRLVMKRTVIVPN